MSIQEIQRKEVQERSCRTSEKIQEIMSFIILGSTMKISIKNQSTPTMKIWMISIVSLALETICYLNLAQQSVKNK